MAASLTLEVDKSILPGPKFDTIFTVTLSSEMPREIFVFHAGDDTFNRIARIDDLTLPVGFDDDFDFYRAAGLRRNFDSLQKAEEFVAHVTNMARALVQAQQELLNSGFVGKTTITVP